MADSPDNELRKKKPLWIWIALLVPYVALLWLPFYNYGEPSFGGLPMFYWYQLLWVPITSVLLYLVYRGEK